MIDPHGLKSEVALSHMLDEFVRTFQYLYIIVIPMNSRTIPMMVNARFIHLIQFGAAWASLRKTPHDQKLPKAVMIARIISAICPVM